MCLEENVQLRLTAETEATPLPHLTQTQENVSHEARPEHLNKYGHLRET